MEPREKIIQHTLELLSKKGYEATSVRDIAAAADVNVAMINYYFGGKEKLFEEVIQDRLSYIREKFTDISRDKTLASIEKIEKIIDLLIERKFSNSMLHHLLHNELALKRRPRLKEKISDFLMLNVMPVKEVIKEGIRKGEFRKVDIELMVTTVIGTIHYLLVSDTMCQKILGKGPDFTPFENKELKKRISSHLKLLVRAYLLQ